LRLYSSIIVRAARTSFRPTDGRQGQLGIDTNMLVRDHATHFDRARRLIPREIAAGEDVSGAQPAASHAGLPRPSTQRPSNYQIFGRL